MSRIATHYFPEVLSVIQDLEGDTAISWDGRVVRHCTSITMPDGLEGRSPLDSSHRKKAAVSNHVYGTFMAAKERIVEAGRRFAAATAASKDDAIVVDDADHPVSDIATPAVKGSEWQELADYVIPKKRRTL
ncbi:hypothetical protein MHU86_1279 [Fragilaria crotonensis]|nr:hypothetical protein MHU86_1279 [Fragilaria crotonensis]